MALPTTGSISAADINTELKRASTALFSLGGEEERNLAGVLTGAISFADFRGKSAEITKTLAAGSTSITLQSLFTSAEWASDTAKRVVLPAGVTRGSTAPGTAAITLGADGWGGDLILEVNGTVEGAGGTANSGVGGSAIDANRLGLTSQKLILNVNPTGVIKGGGGGGGKGGNGGGGTSTSVVREPSSGTPPVGASGATAVWREAPDADVAAIIWYGTAVHRGTAHNGTTAFTVGEWTYYRGAHKGTIPPWAQGPAQQYPIDRYYVYRTKSSTTTVPGGTGGAGGRGEGHGQSRADGAAGAAGSDSAGSGGAGGRGGLFGAAGSVGSPGVAGTSAGTNGAAGGLAGFSVQNPNNAIVNNLGQMVGR